MQSYRWLVNPKNKKRMTNGNVGIQNTKNGMLLAYIAKRIPNIHLRKLLKIVYLIDESFVIKRGYPLTWFTYYAWAKGPVAPEVYQVKSGNFSKFVTARKECQLGEEKSKWIVNTTNSKLSDIQLFEEMGEFSTAELDVIDTLLDKYADKSADELTSLTHQPDSLWSQIVAENNLVFDEQHKQSEVEIPLIRHIKDREDLMEVYEDAKWSMEFQDLLQ